MKLPEDMFTNYDELKEWITQQLDRLQVCVCVVYWKF